MPGKRPRIPRNSPRSVYRAALALGPWIGLLGLAAAVTGGCQREQLPDAPPAPQTAPATTSTTVGHTPPRVVGLPAPRELVVHHARLLEDHDLSAIERLDLALSQADQIGWGGADTEPGDTCAGLDLILLSERAPRLESLRVSGCQTAVHVGLGSFASTLRELELADLVLDGVTIGRLSQLTGLRALTLSRITLGSDPLTPLRELPVEALVLRELDVDSPAAALIGSWPSTLRSIVLEGAWAGHKAMTPIVKARRLQTLALLDTRIGNFSLNLIRSLSELRSVKFHGSTFNDNTPLHLRHVPIREFECACPRLGDTGLRQLRHVNTLTRLCLPESRVTARGIAHLANIEGLADIEIRDRPIDSTALAQLGTLLRLRRLVLSGPALAEPALDGLDQLVRLEVLRLAFPNLGDEIADDLGKLVLLRELDVGGTGLSDTGLESVANLTKLRVLKLHHTRVTKRGLAHLADLANLEVLELDHTDVVDEGVRHLGDLSNLRELRLDSTLVTDRSIDVLLKLHNLERVNLGNTVINADTTRERLHTLPRLRTLGLEGTRQPE